MDELITIETPEFGPLKGTRADLSEIDAVARERVYSVVFLGIYEISGKAYMAFRMQNRTVFAPTEA